MIRIEGNKVALYQWDLDQRIILDDVNDNIEVHFDDAYDDGESLTTETYKENGQIFANIPNILLQKNGIICVYVYVEGEKNAYTKHYAEILVLKRDKPTDYVYTETEIKSFENLAKRLERLEGGGSGGAGSSLPVVSEEDDGKVLSVENGKWVPKSLPVYEGEYFIIPSATDEQVLKTAQTYLDADVKVKKIPYYEVSNNSGGETVYIGSEVE